jgi:hypothetical protein
MPKKYFLPCFRYYITFYCVLFYAAEAKDIATLEQKHICKYVSFQLHARTSAKVKYIINATHNMTK